MSITVGLIDDHRALTDAMSLLLSNSPHSYATSCAHTYEEAEHLIAENHCDIYLVDMNLGKGDSLDLINFIASKSKPCIVLSAYSDIALIKKAMKVGSKGYLSKSSAATNILAAIDTVLEGDTYFDDIIQSTINASAGVADKIATAQERVMLSQLTKREKEIINLIAQEYTSEEIAKELHLSKHTIDGYRKSLISKLGVRGSVGLAKKI